MTERSDEALMTAYQQGDGTALETLIRRYADRLLGYLIRMTHNPAQAEDLFQETFLRVHRKAHRFKANRRFKPWLFAIATNLAIDTIRKQKRRPLALSLDAVSEDGASLAQSIPSDASDPSEEAGKSELKQQVRAAVSRLPARQRATLELAYFQDLPYREVAEVLGCTVGTVKTQMSRALRTLAQILPTPEPCHAKGGAA